MHPEVLAAIAEANEGHQIAYGEDAYTERLQEVVHAHFGGGAQAFPVFNGTGANVTALTSVLPRWGAVVTSANAHIHTDEGGAPERMTGLKLLTIQTPDGKLTPELIDREAWGWGDEHRAQPLAVSITQSTELGTVYTADEVRAIADHIHERGMVLHLDGARLSNGAASLGAALRDFTTDAGVDILSLGGTKNGLLGGEAVVVLNPDIADGVVFPPQARDAARLEDAIHLGAADRAARGRPLAAVGDPLERDGCAPAGARSRASTVSRFTQATQANAIFAILPPGVADRVRKQFRFYDWNPATGEVRWMTSFDTTEADVDAFVAAIKKELG